MGASLRARAVAVEATITSPITETVEAEAEGHRTGTAAQQEERQLTTVETGFQTGAESEDSRRRTRMPHLEALEGYALSLG
jgi:hypothetical protein